ncbi:hypothetical protein GF359_08495 [candidate division WOR-3 bacterium]|uniref:Capsule assembly Wzi family protein n=1 Tax=candidate division WOR-3 bacterium TaxID=2052148 RepID=A0A9D5KA11_UNCW3|nr:hypothetical protein [candidate division WOR-3 bacterium]MBD3365238.1 hypothetical protein [candidate division WOR-3 bacterium]
MLIVALFFSYFVPLNDPAYEVIDRLETKGILQGLPDTRPYTVGDLSSAVQEGNGPALSDADIFDLERLILPVPDSRWVPALKLKGDDASFNLGGAVKVSYRMPDSLRAGPEIRYYGGIGPASFFATHRLTYAPSWDTVFDAKSWRGEERPVYAEVPDARLDFNFSWLHVQTGRSQLKVGPVPDGGLLLSTQPWGLDHAAYTLKWKGVRFSTFFSWLQTDKRLVMHRFEYSAPRWKLGLSEVIVSADTNDILPYLFAPTAFYYFMQWNKEQDENILWAVDATVLFPPWLRLYGEFLVDDFAYEPATGPHKLGGTIGGELVSVFGTEIDMRADYTGIMKWTYAQRHDNQNYTFRGRIIGDDLGPDADRLRFTLAWRIIPRIELELKGFAERHGEGDVWRDFADDGAHDYETYHPPFPSGVIEVHLGSEASLKYIILGRSYISLKARLERVNNLGHVTDSTAVRPRVQASLYWEF